MATKSQRQKGRGSAVSSLNAAIEAMNHVESVSNVPPAKFCEHPSHYDRGGFPQSYPGVGNGLLHVSHRKRFGLNPGRIIGGGEKSGCLGGGGG